MDSFIAIQLLWCQVREFGIGSTKNSLIDNSVLILITCLLDIELILQGEILFWSHMGVNLLTPKSD